MAKYTAANFAQPAITSGEAGQVVARSFSVTVTGTVATGDIVKFGVLPAGHKLVDWSIECEAFGTAAPADVGVLNAAEDGLVTNTTMFSAVALGSAAFTRRTVTMPTALASANMNADQVLCAKFGTINTGAANKTVILNVQYVAV